MELFDVPVTVSNPMLSFKNQKTKIVKEYVYVKCDCKRKRAYEVTIMDFSREIMVEILSRLTIKPIFRCKTVCKCWYNLLTSDPLFVKMYQTRSCNFPCILLSNDDSIASVLELKADYDYYSRPRNRPVMLTPEFHIPKHKDRFGYSFDRKKLTLIGSCNGLICLWSGDRYDENYSIYISNPLLGEYFKVKLPEWEKRVRRVAYTLCYSEGSRQYKVLRSVIRKFRGRPEVSELELKDDDDIKTSASIHSFNLVTEEVKPVPVPPGLKTPSLGLRLAELGNCLCLTDSCSSQHVDIWWMKEDDSWTKDCILTNSIPRDSCISDLIPIIFWKDGES
ncbi:F-box protein At3g07870-like [Solanum tuberosum]|uniref:F-box protein At3g07870-like n=1 Tax=Solanum tuberosum TaxID=4113 RepID=UPI00073A2ACD|nr:PREDICTED: F-box protein At3g07870-like [Solanum tuberosum]